MNPWLRVRRNDRDKSFSIYFVDQWQHRLEITTGDYDYVKDRL